MHPGSQDDGICSELDTPADLADFDPMTPWVWQPLIELAAIGMSPVAYTIPHEFIIIKHWKLVILWLYSNCMSLVTMFS